MLDQSVLDKLADLQRRYEQLNELMAQPEVATNNDQLQTLVREQNQLVDVVDAYREYARLLDGIRDAESLLADGSDPEMRQLAQEELGELRARLDPLEGEL